MSNVDKEVQTSVPEVNQAEVEARQFGWVPEEEFKGDKTEWKDAETFLRRGKEINGFLRKDLDKANQKTEMLARQLAEMNGTLAEFKTFSQKSEERAYKRALEELKGQKKQAIEEGNGELVIAIEDQMEMLKKDAPQPQTEKPPTNDPAIAATLNGWLDSNPAFKTDTEVMETASIMADYVQSQMPHLKGVEFLEEVGKRVKKVMPEKFSNGTTNRPSAVGTSSDDGAGRTGSKKKGYNDLPPEAKAACDKFARTMINGKPLLTKEEYISQYQWDN